MTAYIEMGIFMNYNISTSSFRGYSFLKEVNNVRSKATERLASGYRINHASDDAVGSSMSTLMRTQIRGLEQANRNATDGIAMLDSAESGLSEITSILQRLRKLAVQAGNDTNTLEDRIAIQEEANQLLTEIDRIAKTTEFNTLRLLNTDSLGEAFTKSLASLVGVSNISPDGRMSEIYGLWDILDPTSGGANATLGVSSNNLPILTEISEYETTEEGVRYNYDSFQLNGANYSGTLYDNNGNPIGSVTAGGTASLNGNSILPDYVMNSSTTQIISSQDSKVWTAPCIQNQNITTTVTGTNSSSAAPGSVYGMDATGTLVPLSYNINEESVTTVETGTRYENKMDQHVAVTINFEKFNTPGGFTASDLYGTGFNCTCATCDNHYSIKFVQGNTNNINYFSLKPTSPNERHFVLEIGIDALPTNATGEDLANHIVDAIRNTPTGLSYSSSTPNYGPSNLSDHYTKYAAKGSTLYIFDERNNIQNRPDSSRKDIFSPMVFENTVQSDETYTPKHIQTGANAYDFVTIDFPFISVEELGVNEVNLLSAESAGKALTAIDNALSYISSERSELGTWRTRLEHVSSVNETSFLNLTDSESKIHDADYSDEMLTLTKAQVLEEYGINSVAEINKMIQNVMNFIEP